MHLFLISFLRLEAIKFEFIILVKEANQYILFLQLLKTQNIVPKIFIEKTAINYIHLLNIFHTEKNFCRILFALSYNNIYGINMSQNINTQHKNIKLKV